MGVESREIPPPPQNPEYSWFGAPGSGERQEYEATRTENIEEQLPGLMEKFTLYFPDIVESDPEMAAAFVLRWSTGLRNSFEEGMEQGMKIERNRFRQERERFHSIEITRLGGYG